jgi:hypothetical protein
MKQKDQKVRKCEKSAKNAMQMRCESGAMGLDESAEANANAKNFSHYHPSGFHSCGPFLKQATSDSSIQSTVPTLKLKLFAR